MLREYNKKLHEQYINSPVIADKVIEYLLPEIHKEDRGNYVAGIIAYLIVPNEQEDFERLVKPYQAFIETNPFDKKVFDIANNLRDRYEQNFDKQTLRVIVERIELFHQITLPQ